VAYFIKTDQKLTICDRGQYNKAYVILQKISADRTQMIRLLRRRFPNTNPSRPTTSTIASPPKT
jgi:hypothetical protein